MHEFVLSEQWCNHESVFLKRLVPCAWCQSGALEISSVVIMSVGLLGVYRPR